MPKMSLLVPAISGLFLAFLAGAFAILYDVPPSGILRDAKDGAEAAYAAQVEYRDPRRTDMYVRAERPETGVTIHEAGAGEGYTLYLSPPGSSARLIDMEGNLVHEWQLPFSEIWDETSAVATARPDRYVYWRWAKPMPNGDIYILAAAGGATPWGYGLFKLDKDSNLIWKYLEQTHHDFTVLPDGRVVTLTHAFREEPLPNRPDIKTPIIDDFLVVLSPDGEEETKISLHEALLNSDFAPLIDVGPAWSKGDLLHTNAAKPIDADAARLFSFAEEGQVLVSFRNIDTLALVDPEEGRITWALRGPWLQQHDPDILPNGNLLLYDNLGVFGPGGRSRIMEFDPETGEIEWSYRGTPEQPFQSEVRGSQQRLPNGNTLVVESMRGRLFEVTRGGDVVWEFLNPSRDNPPDDPDFPLVGAIMYAERVPLDFPDFAFNRTTQTARSD